MERKTVDKQAAHDEHVPRIRKQLDEVKASWDTEWKRNQVWNLYGQVSILRDLGIINQKETLVFMEELNSYKF